MSGVAPLIARIKRLSMDDGPGLRDVVFFKGCNLRCVWCHNPETFEREQTLRFWAHKCVECRACEVVCERQAVLLRAQSRIDASRCNRCGACVEACPSRAIEMVGKEYSPKALAALLCADKPYFDNSKGGVTFSGGEPTLHMSYLEEVAKRLKADGISIVLETNGDFDMPRFEQHLLSLIDTIYFDIKLLDDAAHRRFTGGGNRRILANLKYLSRQEKVRLVPRVPLIPNITDTDENLKRIEALLDRLDISRFEKLPFNAACRDKWQHLGSMTPTGRPHPVKNFLEGS